jgi:hypothetical protein
MATNATTWFYKEPETGRPYLISERLTHTFWANRLSDIYLTCTRAESPYEVVGEWDGKKIEMEWEVKKRFKLVMEEREKGVIQVCSEVLGFRPSVSYINPDGQHVTEWYLHKDDARERINAVQADPAYRSISTRRS